jgi:hypothetical protein
MLDGELGSKTEMVRIGVFFIGDDLGQDDFSFGAGQGGKMEVAMLVLVWVGVIGSRGGWIRGGGGRGIDERVDEG